MRDICKSQSTIKRNIWKEFMNYTDKMNSMMQQSQCVNGLCEHLEHKVNALVWIIPAIAAVYFASAIYKKYFR